MKAAAPVYRRTAWHAGSALRPTHLGELFTILQRRLRGLPSGYTGADRLHLELRRYRMDAISAVLFDPYDGRRYELVLRPIEDSRSPPPER
jgi:hypothetical protein